MFLFGVVNMCQGFTKNWGGFVATRFLLGMGEGCMLPGCMYTPSLFLALNILITRANTNKTGFYLMGMWYRRNEAQKRFSFFYSSTSLAGAFGGLLASGLGEMGGVQNYSGWRWIFIIEGIITIAIAFCSFFLIPDFPEETKWLSDEERSFVRARLALEFGKSNTRVPVGVRDVLNVFKDCMAQWITPCCSLHIFGLLTGTKIVVV